MPASVSFAPSPQRSADGPSAASAVRCGIAVDAALRLTAIALLLRPMGPWFVKPVILAIAALALIDARVRQSWIAWLVVAACVGLRIAADWPLADNHIYLLGYWCLAVAIALGVRGPAEVLPAASRLLIGGAFTFAVLWKAVLAPEYLDGRFFRVTFLTDPRFGDVAVLFGGLTSDELAANRVALDPLPEGAELITPPTIVEPMRLRAIAAAATWGGIGLEALVAVTSLWAAASRSAAAARATHAALIAFCLTTYALAPVAGFGWLLLVMGLSQCADQQRMLPKIYIGVFLVVLFYSEVPWAGLVLDWFT